MNGPYLPPPPPQGPHDYRHPGQHDPRYAVPPGRGVPILVWILLGGMLLGLGTCVGITGLVVWGAHAEEGGVLFGPQISVTKRTALQRRGVVGTDDEVLAYYDDTVSLDMSDVYVLTTHAIVHATGGDVTAIPLDEITTLTQTVEGITGDVIEVATKDAARMRIEVAHFNNGVGLLDALEDQIKKKHSGVIVHRQTPRK